MPLHLPDTISVIVGLGNPGDEYANTRHNAGFAALDVLAERLGARYWKNQAGSLVSVIRYQERDLVLAKPQSFMNNSGGPVAKLLAAYECPVDELLVIHDDLDLPAWDVRLKFAGGHGGHNGLRSIFEKCSSRDFARVRVGIGRPPGRMDPADFVLQRLKSADELDFLDATQRAADSCEWVLEKGFLSARDHFNGLHNLEPDNTNTEDSGSASPNS